MASIHFGAYFTCHDMIESHSTILHIFAMILIIDAFKCDLLVFTIFCIHFKKHIEINKKKLYLNLFFFNCKSLQLILNF